MAKAICTISLAKSWLDNDYTFFDDGSIEHLYDKHETKPNISENLTANQIPDETKNKLLAKCPQQHKAENHNNTLRLIEE